MAKQAHGSSSDIAKSNIASDDADTSLTELEGVILGIIWSRQPCSAYVVLRRFEQSPTWGWSSSTGAIYPAIRRLKVRGLIGSELDAESPRKAVCLSLTDLGLQVLQDWISNLAAEMGSAGVDPIRTRTNYLAALDPAAREAFVDLAEEITLSQLELIPASRPDPLARGNWTLEAANIGITLNLKARLKWLRQVRRLMHEKHEP